SRSFAMSESRSTPQPARSKPARPYPEFPLGPHPAGYWCKKIRGKIHYFGPRFDPADPTSVAAAADAALKEYEQQRDDLHAGRTPRPDPEALSVKDVANAFMNAKAEARDAGELSPRTWADYKAIMAMMLDGFGKQRLVADLRPDDFAALKNTLAKRNG